VLFRLSERGDKQARTVQVEPAFLALNHLAAAIMAFKKNKMDVNIIYV
jgi:hypothetical protein